MVGLLALRVAKVKLVLREHLVSQELLVSKAFRAMWVIKGPPELPDQWGQ